MEIQRNEKLEIKLSKQEKELIMDYANSTGVTPEEYVRSRIMNVILYLELQDEMKK